MHLGTPCFSELPFPSCARPAKQTPCFTELMESYPWVWTTSTSPVFSQKMKVAGAMWHFDIRITKRVLIWRDQELAFLYTIYFQLDFHAVLVILVFTALFFCRSPPRNYLESSSPSLASQNSVKACKNDRRISILKTVHCLTSWLTAVHMPRLKWVRKLQIRFLT